MQRQRSSRRRPRKGIEAVETAVTLPLLALAVFATIEITHEWHNEKMIKLATYEAMKVGASVDGTSADANRVFMQHMEALGIQGARLRVNRNFDNADIGDRIWMEGSARSSVNRAPTPHVLPSKSWLSGGRIRYFKEGL